MHLKRRRYNGNSCPVISCVITTGAILFLGFICLGVAVGAALELGTSSTAVVLTIIMGVAPLFMCLASTLGYCPVRDKCCVSIVSMSIVLFLTAATIMGIGISCIRSVEGASPTPIWHLIGTQTDDNAISIQKHIQNGDKTTGDEFSIPNLYQSQNPNHKKIRSQNGWTIAGSFAITAAILFCFSGLVCLIFTILVDTEVFGFSL